MNKISTMNPSKIVVFLILATMLTFSARGYAQALPEIENTITQGSQIDDIIREQDRLSGQIAKKDDEIDGEAGIYVLKKNEIFFVGGTAGIGYSGNPVRTVDDVGDSFFINFAATAGVQTQIGEALDFGARVNVSGIEYGEAFGPSSRNINGNINVGVPIKGTPLYASASAFGGFNFDDDFGNVTSFYGASVSLSAALQLGKQTIVRPNIVATRQWNETADNNNKAVSASVGVVHIMSSRFSLAADARVTRTWFDDFFEDVTFVKRKDWSYGGSVSGTYRHNQQISLSVSAGYEKRDSTFFLSEYDSFEASLLFSAIMRF